MFKLFRFSIIGKGNSCDILSNLSNILAARLGATPMAAFQFCLQFWMTSSLLSDGLAIAGQLHRNRATLTDEQLEVHTISAWKEGKSQQYGEAVRAAQLMFGRPLIWVTYPTSHQHASWSLDDLPRIVACTMHQGSVVTSMDFHPSHHTLLLAMMVFDQ